MKIKRSSLVRTPYHASFLWESGPENKLLSSLTVMRNRYFAHIVEKQGALCDHLDFTSTFFILLLRLGFTFVYWSNLSSNIMVIERLSKKIKIMLMKGSISVIYFLYPSLQNNPSNVKPMTCPDFAWLSEIKY